MPVHPPNILSHLPPEAHLGPIDPETLPAGAFEATEEELRIAKARAELPEPAAALNLQDIEVRLCFGLFWAKGLRVCEGVCGEGAHADGVGVLPFDGRRRILLGCLAFPIKAAQADMSRIPAYCENFAAFKRFWFRPKV